MHDPTAEQESILSLQASGSSNIMINALAGTGKTTMLKLLCSTSSIKPILYLCFSKRDKEHAEREQKAGEIPSWVTIRNFNGLGQRVWSSAVSSIKVDSKKMADMFKEHANSLKGDIRRETWDCYWPVLSAINLAKSLGYVPEGAYPHARRLYKREDLIAFLEEKPSVLTLELIDHFLLESIRAAYKGWIDFNDQIYMPALFGGTFPRFPLVVVDEGQDQNPVNHAMLDKLCRGRMYVVGDDAQSVYAFRGAVQGGMGTLRDRFKCEARDLTVSFRCPQAVVEAARWRVPNFQWSKPGGRVEGLQNLEARSIPEASTILCRNNAPLFRTALGLLMAKRSVQVSGSELGPKLVRLLQRICSEQDTQDIMLGKIEAWKWEKLDASQAPDRVNDEAECLKIFASFGKTLAQAVAYVEHMFKQQGAIKLMTGHKAKGGEWPVVYMLDPWLCKDVEQDQNLRYVMQTRAEEELYEIDSRDIRW